MHILFTQSLNHSILHNNSPSFQNTLLSTHLWTATMPGTEYILGPAASNWWLKTALDLWELMLDTVCPWLCLSPLHMTEHDTDSGENHSFPFTPVLSLFLMTCLQPYKNGGSGRNLPSRLATPHEKMAVRVSAVLPLPPLHELGCWSRPCPESW